MTKDATDPASRVFNSIRALFASPHTEEILRTLMQEIARRYSDDLAAEFANMWCNFVETVRVAAEEQASQKQAARAAATPVEDLPDSEVRAYREAAQAAHAHLPVAGFGMALRVPIGIEALYVTLHAAVAGQAKAFDAAGAAARMRARGGEQVALAELWKRPETRGRRGAVILGDPGSGKTTHLKRLLLWCLREGPESLGLSGGMLPALVPLRDVKQPAAGLDACLKETLGDLGPRLLARGNLLVLLDGLNEMEAAARAKVARWVDGAVAEHPTCRFVVTSRFAGYAKDARLSADFLELHLRPLGAEQAKDFVRRWYGIVETGLAAKDEPSQEEAARVARERAQDLLGRLGAPDFRARRVFELTRNPLLLANLCLVHRDRGQLPRHRAKLYAECVDILLEHWRRGKGLAMSLTVEQSRQVLQPAALWLHEQEGRTAASEQELAPVIEPHVRAVGWTGGGAREFLRAVRDESGILTGWGPDRYGFMHLGFQEYLAAREIWARALEQPGGADLGALAARFGESWWQEVTLLLLAQDPPLFDRFMRELVKLPAFAEHPELVDMCLDDALRVSAEPFADLLAEKPGRDRGLRARQAAALRVLARKWPEEVEKL